MSLCTDSNRSSRRSAPRAGGAARHQPPTAYARRRRLSGRENDRQRHPGAFGGMCPDLHHLNRAAVACHTCTLAHQGTRIARVPHAGATVQASASDTRIHRGRLSAHSNAVGMRRTASAGACSLAARVLGSEVANAHQCAPDRRLTHEFRIGATRIVDPAFLIRDGRAHVASELAFLKSLVSIRPAEPPGPP
jgi:hypothetical protein